MSPHGKALTITALLLTAITVVGWSAYRLMQQPMVAQRPNTNHITSVPPVLPTDPTLGPANASVTIIGFFDFACGPCARAFSMLQDIHRRMPDVRIVWKDLPEHDDPNGMYVAAHAAARCADRRNRFWEYASEIFSRQDTIESIDLSAITARLSLDDDAFQKCFTSESARSAVQANILQAEERGIFSTPYFFINTRRVDGVIPLATFLKYIVDARSGL